MSARDVDELELHPIKQSSGSCLMTSSCWCTVKQKHFKHRSFWGYIIVLLCLYTVTLKQSWLLSFTLSVQFWYLKWQDMCKIRVGKLWRFWCGFVANLLRYMHANSDENRILMDIVIAITNNKKPASWLGKATHHHRRHLRPFFNKIDKNADRK